MSEPTKTEEPTLNVEEVKNSKPEESKDNTDGRKSPSSDPLLEAALLTEEKKDDPKIPILKSKRNKIMTGIALTVLLIVGIAIVVWFLTAKEPDFNAFEVKNQTSYVDGPIKIGGAQGATGAVELKYAGCEGKLTVRPKLKRPDIEVDHSVKIGQRFKIVVNQRNNKKKTDYIETTGNCCWEISNRQLSKDKFGRAEARAPKNIKYITAIKTIDCHTI